MAAASFYLRLTGVHTLAPGVKHFQFERTDQQLFSFIPGQFITLLLPHEGKKLRRSYSVASLPGQDNTLDFAASYVDGGAASEFLFNLAIGSEVEAIGPAGRLILREEDHPARYLLIATGTGITPYRTMLPTLATRMQTEKTNVIVMQGVRTPADLLYEADFLVYVQQYPQYFQFGAYYSRYDTGELKAHEHRGNVCRHLASLAPNPTTDIVYLCGNPKMIDEAYEFLKQKGFDATNARREKYISGGSA